MGPFKVISFNHKNLPLEEIAKLHLNEELQATLLGAIKINFGFDELMLLSTCNRVEFFVCTGQELSAGLLQGLLKFVNSHIDSETTATLTAKAELFEGEDAIRHVFEVASSLDSLVIGEREIITQVRKAYEFCNLLGLTGDFIRLVVKQTIETAKDVFTHTDIAKNPVSVVSLAYRQLRDLGIRNEARIVMVGAGETNTSMANYLQKHKFANFAVFNRTPANAKLLAKKLDGKGYALTELETYNGGFDVLITCTGSTQPLIHSTIYSQLLNGESTKKVIIDLALPADVDATLLKQHNITYIDINSLKSQAEKNLQSRLQEMEKCGGIIDAKLLEFKALYKERKIELAFGEIPKQVKAIKELAMNEVFLKEVNALDDKSKEVLDKVLCYVEKKYNAVAMKTAKDVLMSKEQ
ncbi:MAG: glutamyl-tRNA reductase [Bacteroidia bacterium]